MLRVSSISLKMRVVFSTLALNTPLNVQWGQLQTLDLMQIDPDIQQDINWEKEGKLNQSQTRVAWQGSYFMILSKNHVGGPQILPLIKKP